MLANFNMQAFYFTTLAGIYGSTGGNDKHNSYYQPINFFLAATDSLSETPPPRTISSRIVDGVCRSALKIALAVPPGNFYDVNSMCRSVKAGQHC